MEDDWKGVCGDTYTDDGLGFAESVVALPAFAWKPWDGEPMNVTKCRAFADSQVVAGRLVSEAFHALCRS